MMTYQEQLNPWIVQQQSHDGQTHDRQKVIARFRRRTEADSYRNAMQQMRPNIKFSVVFAAEVPAKDSTPVSP